jgi:hypothetical protein
MSSNYVIAIPSYKRQDVIIEKSLKTLKDGGVPASKIHIFMANEEERDAYEKTVPKELYGKLVVGVKGITEQRRFIIDYFPENQYVVSLDDDVERLEKLSGLEKLVRIRNLDKFFKQAYEDMKKHGLHIWGIYPVRNPFFMKPKVTTDLKFIIGTLYGFINRHDKGLRPSPKIKEKEDVEQSILYFLKDGGVLRYNHTTIKTKFHSEGGLGKKDGRFENNKVAAAYLAKTYPDLVTIFHRKTGMAEVKLARTSTQKKLANNIKKTVKQNKTKKNTEL